MHADTYSAPGSPTAANEDLALNGDHLALVLDGAGRYPGVDIQCIHDVAWLAGTLGSHLSVGLGGGGGELTDVLAEAIRATAADHGPECDTTHPLALGATVAVVRTQGSMVDWLVLGDAAVLIEDTDRNVEVVTDDRLERLSDPPVTDPLRGPTSPPT